MPYNYGGSHLGDLVDQDSVVVVLSILTEVRHIHIHKFPLIDEIRYILQEKEDKYKIKRKLGL